MLNEKRSQMLTLDIIIAYAIILMVLIFFFWSWSLYEEKYAETFRVNDMNTIALYASSSLIETYGLPANWSSYTGNAFNKTTISSLGLMVRPGVLSYSKINYLVSLNATKYAEIKDILGVMGPKYHLKIEFWFYGATGYPTDPNLIFGHLPENTGRVYKQNRFFVIDTPDRNWSKMVLTISKEREI